MNYSFANTKEKFSCDEKYSFSLNNPENVELPMD